MKTVIHWYETAKEKPREWEFVVVHGGVAQFHDSQFFTGMSEPYWESPIQWPVTHWALLGDLRPKQ